MMQAWADYLGNLKAGAAKLALQLFLFVFLVWLDRPALLRLCKVRINQSHTPMRDSQSVDGPPFGQAWGPLDQHSHRQ